MNAAINQRFDGNSSFDDDDDYILSLAWKQSILSAVYFSKKTLNVFLVKEIDDFKPGFSYTANLLRQLSPSVILASGSAAFQNELIRLLNYPPNTDISKLKYTPSHNMPMTNLVLFSHCDTKHLRQCRQRILSLDLPGMQNNMTDIERSNFMETVISSHQDQLVISFGNLLTYLDATWIHLFLTNVIKPTIASVTVRALDRQVLIDEDTLNGLHVFFVEQHPAGFKIGTEGASKEGFSLYSLMNRCHSKIGRKVLKCLMQQPTNSLEELNSRFDTVNWCLDKNNCDSVERIKLILKKTGNINEDFAKLTRNPTNRKDWLSFLINILNLCNICQLCLDLVENGEKNVLMNKLAVQGKPKSALLCVSASVCNMIHAKQLEQSDGHIIRKGFHQGLDDIRELEDQVRQTIYEKFIDLVKQNYIAKYTVTLFAEIGYVLGVIFDDAATQANFNAQSVTNQLEFILESQNIFFYKFHMCHELNESYKELNVRVRCQEEKICKEFLSWYAPNIPTIQHYTELCAKLDCMIVFAEIAEEFNLIRPELTSEKMLQIIQGRHFLFDSNKKVMPNDTIVKDKRFMTLLMAPNAAGKSFYLKQVGLIVYMAHIGSFVPAESAKIGLVGAIFSRLYTEESIHNSQSSFQSELIQMSRILSCSTERSLILIDEFGKGTNLINGKSIFLACVEHLLARQDSMPITFITSHFSEVFDYFGQSEWIRTKTFEMYRQENGSIFSTHQLIDGRGMQSYAHQCEEVKVFLDWILNKQSSESCSETSDFAVESFNEEVDDIYHKKIEFSTHKFCEFMMNSAGCSTDTFQQLLQFNVTNKLREY